jgi:flagellar basal-body rod protein FlgB
MHTDKVKLLGNAMQAYNWRTQALTSNLANIDTPGYERMSVRFEDSLQEARRSVVTFDGTADVEPTMDIEKTAPVLEDELMEMADTQMRAQTVSRALREHFDTVRMGITGRTG